MASHGLTRMAKRMLDRLDKAGVREDVQDHEGQIFIWKREDFKAAMRKHTTEEIVEKLVVMWRAGLVSSDTKVMKGKQKKRLLQAKAKVQALGMDDYDPTQHELYAVFKYITVETIKRNVGVEFHKLTGKDSGLVTGKISKGQKASEAQGTHIGHGEFGHAVSTTKALGAEAVMKTKTMQTKYSSDPAYQRLQSHIVKYKENMGIDLEVDHYQEVTARGKLSKKYTAVLSSQEAGDNMLDALPEKEALAELRAAIEADYQELLHEKGSDSLYEAIESVVVMGNLTEKPAVKRTKGAKAKKHSKSSADAKKKGSVKADRQVMVASSAGAVAPKQRRKAKRSRTSNPLRIIGILNKELPNTVRKNMGSPGLENVTGRFAESVEVTDIIQTKKGFPSIGYTYAKNPYQVFEDGAGKAPWADGVRDPRTLIDRSIREIAAQFAMGRFYTRRQ